MGQLLISRVAMLGVAVTAATLILLAAPSPAAAKPGWRRARRPSGQLGQALALLGKPVRGGAWRNLRWRQLRRQVAKQLKTPTRIDQGKLHLCMSAVALNLTAERDPLRYVELVREVYQRGSFNGRGVSRKLRKAKPTASTNPLDWMMLSASRNAYGRPGFAGKEGFGLSAINLPGEMNRQLSEVSGLGKLRSYWRVLRSGAKLIPKLNRHLVATPRASKGGPSRASKGEVVLLMSMKGIRPGLRHHNLHWTHLLAPIERLPAAAKVDRPRYDATLGAHIVTWQERDGSRGREVVRGGKREARALARTLGKRRVKLQLFDHGKKLTAQISERRFSRQLLSATLASASE
jgi:hypothetical protein